MKKYVLTGGPGIGKTTVIEILASMDYEIVPETSRIIIEEQKLQQDGIFPWNNILEFQRLVAERQIENENKINRSPAFLDRSIVDGHGYCRFNNIETPQLIKDHAPNRYDKIFVLEPLISYKLDTVRFESKEDAELIHKTVCEAYLDFGYEIIGVPVMLPEERVKFILDKIK